MNKKDRIFVSILSLATCLILLAVSGDSYLLKYKMEKGSILKYEVVSNMEQNIEMGSEQISTTESKQVVQITSEGMNDAGNLVYIMKITSMNMHIQNPMMDSTLVDLPGVIGKRIRKEIVPSGDQVQSTEIDTFELEGLLAQNFRPNSEFLPNLPTAEIAEATKLTVDDVDTNETMGGSIVAKSSIEYTLQGKEAFHGHNCIKLSIDGIVDVEGTGKTQGMKFFVEGDGTVTGTLFFAPDEGLLVLAESESIMEMTLAVTGQENMTIPITQITDSKITLLSE